MADRRPTFRTRPWAVGRGPRLHPLRTLGFEIVDRNWRCDQGEIDLVVRLGDTVRVLRGQDPPIAGVRRRPAAAVDPKQRRIRRLAVAWLRANQVSGVEVRFDVVAITGVRVDVIEAAF